MDSVALPWPVTICGEVTVLHGGFLLAARLSHPKPLSELAKADWPTVGQPILDALAEICVSRSAYPPRPESWKENAAVLLWAKVLLAGGSSSPAATTSQQWKDDPFFSAGNMIPEVGRTVLYELFKAIDAPRLFARLLLALPAPVCRAEAQRLVDYVAQETSAGDVGFFLDAWWEALKHRDREDDDDRLTASFRAVCRQFLSDPGEEEEAGQPPKRFKSDPPPLAETGGLAALGALAVLAEGLKLIKGSVTPTAMKCHAVANLLDGLPLLVGTGSGTEELPIHTYLGKIASVVTLWSRGGGSNLWGDEEDLAEKVTEAERSLSVVAKVADEPPPADLAFLCSLLKEWAPEIRDLLRDPRRTCYESYRLLDRLARLQERLAGHAGSADPPKRQQLLELGELAADLLRGAGPESPGEAPGKELVMSVAAVILNKRAARHAEVCSVFAGEKAWASSHEWAACLARNRDLFQKPELVSKLLETAVSGGGPPAGRAEQQHRVAKVLLDCYAGLSLAGQNEVIAAVLARWGRRGLSAAWAVFSEGFQEDLNVTFNQVIQSSSSGEGFGKAAATAVSRLVLLDPEATVRKICRLAVTNLGTHRFLAEVLCAFPALAFREPPEADVSLVMRCLKESAWERLSSAKEKEQFLEFLECLLQPSGASPLLRPAEVTQSLVQPFLRSDCPLVELSLRVLDQALKVPGDPAWVRSCHPFPLLFSLCKLLDGFARYWHEPQGRRLCSLEAKELVAGHVALLCEALLAQKEALSPELWAQSVAWLHKKAGGLDWTVGLRLQGVYGGHFKREAPGTLFEVCRLPEEEWAARACPGYGPGSGLLAWLECCCVSAALREQMLVLLAVNVDDPEEVNLFSKGFLVALVQVFPWCSRAEWGRLGHVVRALLEREVLFVPYSLEYVHALPLLNLRPFAGHLRLSVLLLRAFQLLCGASCASWLPAEAWRHVAQLYCLSLSELLGSVKSVARGQWRAAEAKNVSRELAFLYVQLFCHALHVAAMLPEEGLPAEAPILLALEVLGQYEALCDADEAPGSALRKANERHFLASVAESVAHKELRAVLLQKLRKL